MKKFLLQYFFPVDVYISIASARHGSKKKSYERCPTELFVLDT